MNILILSCGTRNKIIQYFKKSLSGKGTVVAADCSPLAPALYEADKYYLTPRLNDKSYIEKLLNICVEEQIDGVLSLIDPELPVLAENAEAFANIGTRVIGSAHELCKLALDKWQMYLWLKEHNYLCAKSYIAFEDFRKDFETGNITFPVFVKPRFGSGSINISKADDMATAEFLFRHQENMMVQEFMKGQEIGADCYIDLLSKEIVSIFTKKKLVMRAGETDKSISFKDPALFLLLKDFIETCGFVGQIDMDVFLVDGQYYISEVNPRFGGGYPHAYACGVDTPSFIANNIIGIRNIPSIGNYAEGMVMMKYNELIIRSELL